MRLAFHWFYLKSRSLLLVYVGAISDSYTDYFLSRCLAKTTTELATMCKHKPKNPSFLDLREFAGFCGRFADFCGMFAGRFGRVFLFFCGFCAKVLCTEKVTGQHQDQKWGCTYASWHLLTRHTGAGNELWSLRIMLHTRWAPIHQGIKWCTALRKNYDRMKHIWNNHGKAVQESTECEKENHQTSSTLD